MRFHISFEAFATITGDAVPRLRHDAQQAIQRVLSSGCVVLSGVYVGKRGGFVVMDVDSPEKLFTLIGEMVDSFQLTVDAIVSMDVLDELLHSPAVAPW